MNVREDFLRSLLSGLPQDDQIELLESIRSAYDDQLDRKRHPRRRRRRNADGLLELPVQSNQANQASQTNQPS
jgi:hypothetical protein